MKVMLMSCPDRALSLIYAAGRCCKSAKNPIEIYSENILASDKPALEFAIGLRNAGHLSVFEHVALTFAVAEVSRALLAQITRHRHLSFSVQSQRAVCATKFPGRAINHIDLPHGNDEAKALYKKLIKTISKGYEDLVKNGVKYEDARMILPQAACTNMVISMNLRSFIELWEKRVVTPGAQQEIRDLIVEMAKCLEKKYYWIFELLK